jgi:hypothetical protein
MKAERLLLRFGQRRRPVEEVSAEPAIFLPMLHHQLRVKQVGVGNGRVDTVENLGPPLLRTLLGALLPVVLDNNEQEKKRRNRHHPQLVELVL